MRGESLRTWLLFCFWLACPLTWAQPVEPGDEVVRVTGARTVAVRQSPSSEGIYITSVARGAQLHFLDDVEGWFQVRLSEETEGWISGDYAVRDQAQPSVEVIVEAARIREQPSTSADILGYAQRREHLRLLDRQGEWLQVRLPDQEIEGWVRQDLVTPVVTGESALSDSSGPSSELQLESAPEEVSEAENGASQVEPVEPGSEAEPDPYGRGLRLLEEGRREEALEAFRSAVAANPEDGEARFQLGRLLYEEGETYRAIPHLEEALEADPPVPQAARLLTQIEEELTASEGTTPAEGKPEQPRAGGFWQAGVLVVIIVAVVAVMAVGSFLFLRRRKMSEIEAILDSPGSSLPKRRKQLDRLVEESQKRQEALDAQIQQKFRELRGDSKGGLASTEFAEEMCRQLDTLREMVVEQEKKVHAFSDILKLQNEKLELAEKEKGALRKLSRPN